MLKIKTAVLSVSDKVGIVDFARFLKQAGVEIISTGGTAKLLKDNGIEITPISRITGNTKEDYFDGRMKTISFNYESSLLYKRDKPEHVQQAQELGIPTIDLVVCNLYPFEKVTASAGVSVEDGIENIDIGGPCMVRAAAKNYQGVAIVVEPDQYSMIQKEMEANKGSVSRELREKLMVRAFEKTADYDSAINTFFAEKLAGEKVKRLKYGQGVQLGRYAENWHQQGWLYKSEIRNPKSEIPNVPRVQQVHGGPLGYNNYLDAEAALQSALEIQESVAVSVIKHANPCGYATGETLAEAFERAWQGDPVSAFGSVIALTRPLDLAVAKLLGERFVEVVIAPSIDPAALKYIQGLGKKKVGLRLLTCRAIGSDQREKTYLRFIAGGLLEQELDNKFYLPDSINDLFKNTHKVKCSNSGQERPVGIATKVKPNIARAGLYEFALRHIKHVKSNAISIAREYRQGYYQVLGMGCGQPNRKDSVSLAGQRAVDNLKREYKVKSKKLKVKSAKNYVHKELKGEHVVLVSDAFFPFRDGIDNVAKTGVKYVIEPGGSIRDGEVIKAANEYKMGIIFTGVRKFYH
ncbi:MAG: bifunctional phosphoribosylaminoimidazolecarboxamide formyltransferase/IMP cyclohydrolase [Planctomycetes bacterium]|nr:bifunctional phosphoribosylaminoimidazolecarboxamide formyltransferase/IMP cyclohydrolase [Planctomycetota bacterium]